MWPVPLSPGPRLRLRLSRNRNATRGRTHRPVSFLGHFVTHIVVIPALSALLPPEGPLPSLVSFSQSLSFSFCIWYVTMAQYILLMKLLGLLLFPSPHANIPKVLTSKKCSNLPKLFMGWPRGDFNFCLWIFTFQTALCKYALKMIRSNNS